MNTTETKLNEDHALKNALAHREFLAKEINDINAKFETLRRDLARVDLFIEDWRRFASGGRSEGGQLTHPTSTLASKLRDQREKAEKLAIERVQAARQRTEASVSVRRNSKKEDVARAARELIEHVGRPLMREELYPSLISKGLVIDGGDKLMVLSTMLWRMKEIMGITRLKGGGYWLAERPTPDGTYFPVPVQDLRSNVKGFIHIGDVMGTQSSSPVDNNPPETIEEETDQSD